MFDSLSDKLNNIFSKLKKRGALTEEDVTLALREIRIALLEADVALPVVKSFISEVKEQAVGNEVLDSITPGQMVVKIVHDHLIKLLGGNSESESQNPVAFSGKPPHVILMVGLQGSGKTTTTAKIAKLFSTKYKKKCLLASTDIYRPAAREQLKILGQEINIDSLDIIADESPAQIAKRAYNKAKIEAYDILFVDTAGRLHIDQDLMDELTKIKTITNPAEIILVADAMTGQDAVNVAKSFQEQISITGISLSRIDGDARGGGALSMRYITNCPIKFVGTGEKVDALDIFHPERIANRILNMGDVVSLVEKASEVIDQKEAQEFASKMQKGSFDFNDMAKQLSQITKLGGLSGVMNMLPGVGSIKDKIGNAGLDDKLMKRQVSIIYSMTTKERKNHKLLNGSRKRRIASGSGVSVTDVNRLVKQYKDMTLAMKRFNKMGKKGLLRQGMGSLFGLK